MSVDFLGRKYQQQALFNCVLASKPMESVICHLVELTLSRSSSEYMNFIVQLVGETKEDFLA